MNTLFSEEFPSAVRLAFELLGMPIGPSLPPVAPLSQAAMWRLCVAIEDLRQAGLI